MVESGGSQFFNPFQGMVDINIQTGVSGFVGGGYCPPPMIRGGGFCPPPVMPCPPRGGFGYNGYQGGSCPPGYRPMPGPGYGPRPMPMPGPGPGYGPPRRPPYLGSVGNPIIVAGAGGAYALSDTFPAGRPLGQQLPQRKRRR